MYPEDDREKMPVFEHEWIFNPEQAVRDLGFDDEDIKDLLAVFKWNVRQRDLRTQKPFGKLIQVLRARQKQLVDFRKVYTATRTGGPQKLRQVVQFPFVASRNFLRKFD